MAQLIGFGIDEERIVRNAMLDSRRALEASLNEAFHDNDMFLRRVEKYFGFGEGGQDATTHLVMKTINSMKVAIDMDFYEVVHGGDRHGTNAAAENLPQRKVTFGGTVKRMARTSRLRGTVIYHGKVVNSLEAILSFSSKNRKVKVTLYDLFFRLPYKQKKSQSQVETFLHELSHSAAGTHDVDSPKCYGHNGVLYCKSVGKGAMNAESYGMFLQSYLI